MMTAIYNLVNEMAKKKNARLYAHPSNLNDFSAPFWAKHMGLEYEGDEWDSAHTNFQNDNTSRLYWPEEGV